MTGNPAALRIAPEHEVQHINFLHKYVYLDSELCKVFNDRATAELRA